MSIEIETRPPEAQRGRPNPSAETRISLESLVCASPERLDAIYRAGKLPSALGILDGTPRGRMLSLVGAAGRGLPRRVLTRLSEAEQFPWRGKTFSAKEPAEGTGINRVRLIKNFELFAFKTRVDASAVDGEPCILLDYNLAANPWPIRQIRDELREVSPGLFMGPAMLKLRGRPTTVLYFAIDKSS